MALTSALYTGLSGLDVNQANLNVIGNNIANVNTTAFKSSRAVFAPQFYLTDQAGSQPTADSGGSNPSQRGLGASVAAIEKDFTQGSFQTTGNNKDMAIDGSGFFIVKGAGGTSYTREGDFTLNGNNELTTNRGDFVMGYGTDGAGNVVQGQLQHLLIPGNLTSAAKASTSATLQGNLDTAGDVASGASILDGTGPLKSISGGTLGDGSALTDLSMDGTTPMFNVGDKLTLNGTKGGRTLAPLTYTVDATSTVKNLEDFFNQGLEIKPDETGPAGYNPPGAQFDTTTNTFKIIGNPGKDNAVSLGGTAFTSSNPSMSMTFSADATSNPTGESVYTSFQAYDSLGTPVNINVTATLESKSDAGSTWRFIAASPDNTKANTFDPTGTTPSAYYGALLGSGTITFDNAGQYVSSTGTSLTLDRTGTGATPQQTVALDFSGMTALSTDTSSLTMQKQDGYPMGEITGFSVGAEGTITGTFSNGKTRTLGQIAIATFDNPSGLVDNGNNLYQPGSNSGAAVITTPTQNNSGAIRSGALEQSNVDISREFINMITASTGFTAASRVITTSDQLLTELMNTNR
ncbi:MAG: flagellar hook protein FlgE [Tepidisphaeraceae bacterium]